MAQPSKILGPFFVAALLLLAQRAAAQNVPPAANVSQEAAKAPKVRLADAYGRLPLSFEANQGQTDHRVKFLSRSAGKTLFLTSTEAVLVLTSREKNDQGSSRMANEKSLDSRESVLRMKLLGVNRDAEATGLERMPGKSNYFIGNDSAKWSSGVVSYRKVRYSQIYPGVDLVYYGNQQELEYDFVVAPGAQPEQIRLTIRGASKIWIDANGNAVLHCEAGDIRMPKPRIYQKVDGREIPVAGGYQLKGHELRFAIAQFNPHQPLIIDPVLSYSTYLGGSGGDGGAALAVDSAGDAYITGFTTSTDFPGIGPDSFQSAPSHLYVSKLNAAGTAIVYSTYLGSSGVDTVNGIAVDPSGNAYVIGYTNGTNFPTTAGAFQQFNHGGYDVFVTKLNPSGSALVYSTYLGGSTDDAGIAIALDSSGDAYLTGYTNSSDFPLAGPIQSTNHLTDAFVVKLNAAGSALLYSTYLGGSGYDQGQGIAVDSAGNAYVTGRTNSTDFPGVSSSSIQSTNGGLYDAFVVKVNAAGTALVYSTYLGGSNYDYGYGVAVDSAGSAYVTGYTSSTNFTGVTSGSVQSTLGSGNGNAYVAKINPAGTGLVYSTYLGGSGGENGTSIATDSSGNAWVTGTTSSTNFPGVNVNSIQSTSGGMIDAFVAELNPPGTALLYSTYLGGSANDFGNAIAVDPGGDVYVAGDTLSPNFPLGSSPLQGALRGTSDAFVVKLSASGAAATKTVLASSPNPSASGQTVTFTATVSVMGGSGTPTGTVTFSDNGVPLTCSGGNQIVSAGEATCQYAFGTSGSQAITAAYSGDSNFAASTSAPLEQVVKQFASSTTLISSSPSSAFGQSVTFTTTVVGVGSGAPVPGGSVAFLDGANRLGIVMLDASGSAALTTSALTAGTHSISAAYGGDANFAGSISSSVSQNVLWPSSLTGPPFLTTIPVGNGPAAMVLNPASNRIYVANRISNNVTVIDAGTYVVVTTIAVGQGPRAIAINSQTNTIYTADYDSSTVTVIDGVTNTVTKQVSVMPVFLGAPLPLAPVAISVDEQNNQIFVGSATAGGTFAIIDGATDSVNYITYLGGPIAFASSLLSDRTYVAFSQDSDIGAYEGITGVRLGDFNSGFNRPVALAADAGRIFAADTTGTLDTIDEVMRTFTRQPVGNSSVSLSTTVPGGPDNQLSVNQFTGDLGVAYAATGLPFNPTNILTLSTSIPAPPISNFRQDFGVRYTDTGLPFERVNSLDCAYVPTGQYTLTVNNQDATYTFCPADAGRPITISYGAILLQGQFFVGSTGLYTFSPADVGAAIVINYNATNSPYALAVNARDARVYLANQSPASGVAATVAVSNAGPGGAFKTVPVGTNTGQVPAPSKIVTDESRDLIYVANDASNDVSIIDGQTVGLITNVPVGVAPSALLRDPFSCDVFAANAGSGTVTVVSALIIGPAICVSTTSLAFGSQAVGRTSAAQSVVLTNIGTADVLISSLAVTGDFTVAGNCLPVPPATSVILHVRQTCTMPVTFTPTTFGIRIGQVTITDNAPGNPQTIELSGDGTISVNVKMAANPNPVVYGQFPALGVTVTPGPGQPTPSGSVTFLLDGQTKLGIQLLDSSGSATLQYPSVPFLYPAGSPHTLTAQYNGDLNYSPTVSPAVSLVITKATTFISADVLTSTAPNQFEVFVSPSSGSGIPSGTVALQEGQNTFASITLGVKYGEGYGATPVLLAPGTHTVTAVYQGDANFLGSSSSPFVVSIQAPPTPTTTTVTSSSPTSTLGSPVTFTATVTANPAGAGNITGNVSFFVDGQSLSGSTPISGTPSSASASTSPITTLTVGQHSITAQFQDPTGQFSPSRSAPLTQTVQSASGGGGGGTNPPPTELVVAAGPNNTPFAVIDFTSPSSPTIVNPNPGYSGGSAIDCGGTRAAVGNQNGGNIVIYDLSNPASPAKMGSLVTVLSGIGAIKVDGNRVLVGEMDGSRVVLIDISNPTSPQILSTLNTGIASISSVALSGTKAVAAGPNNITIAIIDYTDPVNPTQTSFDPKVASGLPGLTVDLDGNLAAVGAQTNPQIALVDITGPSILGTANSGLSGVAGAQSLSVSIKGSQIAVGSSNFQKVALIDFTNPSSPVVSDFDPAPSLSSGWTVSRTPGLLAIGETTGSGVELFRLSGNSATLLGNANSNVASPSTVCMLEINANTTPVGNNVAVQPKDPSTGKSPATVTFPAVNQAGQTTLTSSTSGQKPPDNFKLGNPATYYDLSTTAVFTPPATVCFSYAGVQYSDPSAIQLFHYVSSMNNPWVPITTFNDTVNQIICGTTNSFSPFALFEPATTPTVTVVSAPSVVYGAPVSVTVSANSSSATVIGTVTLSVDGGAAVSMPLANGSAIFNLGVLSAGNHSLSANFAAQGSFTGSSGNGTLVVTQAPLTITANSTSKVYGAVLPTLGFSASGFVNGDSNASLTTQPTLNTTATAASAVGNYSISVSGAIDPNYSIAYTQGTLTVTPAPLTITANSVSKVYGAALPTLGFSASGFVNGDANGSLTTQPTLNTAATASSSVGSYAITIGGAVNVNYEISYVPGTLTVTPASVTLSASSGSRVYGANNAASNPPLGVTITGIQNNDAISGSYSTAATPASPVGTYQVVPMANGAANVLSNYNISLVNGTLAVVPETTSLTVTLSPASIMVGQTTTATITLTAPDMVIPIDPSVLAPITVSSGAPNDILSNSGICTPVPSTTPGVATCTITVTSVEPNGRTVNASFPGSTDLTVSTATADLMVTAALQSQQACIASDFRNVAVPGGSYLWFNSIFKVRDVTKQLIHVSFFKSTVQFQYTDAVGNPVTVNQGLPDAKITIDPNATVASTSFDAINNVWMTTIPWDLDDNAFLTGMPWLVPSAGLPADVEPVTVCGTFASDVASMDIGWRWAAAAYSSFSRDNTTLGVEPMDTDHDNPSTKYDRAGTPENFKQFVVPGARGKGGRNYTGSYTGAKEIE